MLSHQTHTHTQIQTNTSIHIICIYLYHGTQLQVGRKKDAKGDNIIALPNTESIITNFTFRLLGCDNDTRNGDSHSWRANFAYPNTSSFPLRPLLRFIGPHNELIPATTRSRASTRRFIKIRLASFGSSPVRLSYPLSTPLHPNRYTPWRLWHIVLLSVVRRRGGLVRFSERSDATTTATATIFTLFRCGKLGKTHYATHTLLQPETKAGAEKSTEQISSTRADAINRHRFTHTPIPNHPQSAHLLLASGEHAACAHSA